MEIRFFKFYLSSRLSGDLTLRSSSRLGESLRSGDRLRGDLLRQLSLRGVRSLRGGDLVLRRDRSLARFECQVFDGDLGSSFLGDLSLFDRNVSVLIGVRGLEPYGLYDSPEPILVVSPLLISVSSRTLNPCVYIKK